MVSAQEIDRQLKNIGVKFFFFGNPELRELRHILVEHEIIENCVLGRYEGGYAILVATNLRLLLIDKKTFSLTVEDVRYDMIVEVDYGYRLMDASVRVCTPNKTLQFMSFRKADLRMLTGYVQHRVMMYRQQHIISGQSTLQPLPAPDPSTANGGTTNWQPQVFLQGDDSVLISPTAESVKNMAQAAINEAGRTSYLPPLNQMRQAINPYARSSLTMKQRISRF